MASIIENSDMGGFVLVTIPDPAADVSPSSQPCRYCYVKPESQKTVYFNVNAAASAETWLLASDVLGVAVRNLNQLHFFGTAGDTIQILWFN